MLGGIGQQCGLELQVAAGIVGAVLRLAVIESVGAAADGQDGRGLNALGDGHAGEEVPPAFQVSNEFRCRGKIPGDNAGGAAQVLFQRTGGIPFQYILRRRFFPSLDKERKR